jgi:hypothetical protein
MTWKWMGQARTWSVARWSGRGRVPTRRRPSPTIRTWRAPPTPPCLPEELRSAYRDGNFATGLRDHDFQVIPTAWIEVAQKRWVLQQPKGAAMTAIGLDVAQGGSDFTVAAARYGGWYAPLTRKPGKETQTGEAAASAVVAIRRDRCPVVVDVGGGWGGDTVARFKDNGIPVLGFNGANSSTAKTRDGQLAFFNNRAVMRETRQATQGNLQTQANVGHADVKNRFK